jgi:DNA-directed RNA polymerase specialized sigma24 family protein
VALYRKYRGPVYRFARQVCGLRHIAEEVTQDTLSRNLDRSVRDDHPGVVQTASEVCDPIL